MDKLCEVKDILIDVVYDVVTSDIENVDAHELGEIIDVLKDINQYKYYEAVVNAMHTDNSTLSDDVKSKMYYHDPDEETIEEIAKIVNNV